MKNLRRTCDQSYDNPRTNLEIFCSAYPWFTVWT